MAISEAEFQANPQLQVFPEGAIDDPAPQEPRHLDGEDEIHDVESELIDVSGISLIQLRVSDDSVLAHALRRLVDDVSHPDDIVAGFNSTL